MWILVLGGLFYRQTIKTGWNRAWISGLLKGVLGVWSRHHGIGASIYSGGRGGLDLLFLVLDKFGFFCFCVNMRCGIGCFLMDSRRSSMQRVTCVAAEVSSSQKTFGVSTCIHGLSSTRRWCIFSEQSLPVPIVSRVCTPCLHPM